MDTQTTRRAVAFEIDDILQAQRLTALHAVVGHPLVAASVSRIDAASDTYTSRVWTWSPADGQARQLTRGPGHDEAPRWSPDGRQIAFLSDRHGGAAQVHAMPADGGEARQVTHAAGEVVQHAWRCDGSALLALITVHVDPDARRDGTRDLDLSRPERDAQAPVVAWRLPYKLDGQGYQLDRRVHLFRVDATSGEATALTRGDVEVPEACWSSDGSHIAYIATRDQPEREHCTDLWRVEVDGRGRAGRRERLSHELDNVSLPSWSPDGRWIAFAGARHEGDSQRRLWLYDCQRDEVRPLGDEDIEVAGAEFQWRPDSSAFAFVRAWRGMQEVAVIDVPSGRLRALPQQTRHVTHLAATADHLLVGLEGPCAPLELWASDWNGADARCLSDLNGWRRERLEPEVVVRHFQVPDGEGGQEHIDGWLLLPPGRQGSVPLLVDVHGGPASYVMPAYPTKAYWQLMTSRGWAVLSLNTVGSSSYGRQFAERLRSRWGELDFPQLEAAVRQLQQEGVADDRLAITGSSYGGYLSAYAIGTSDLFRAAVVCAPVGNLETHYGTSDSGYYADPYSMKGEPQQDRDLMIRLSPMGHIETAATPTLFLQGEQDERCPKCQAEELFVKLRRSGGGDVATELVIYPGGSHHVFGQGKPSHRVDILRRLVAWLEQWVDQPLPPRRGQAG